MDGTQYGCVNKLIGGNVRICIWRIRGTYYEKAAFRVNKDMEKSKL